MRLTAKILLTATTLAAVAALFFLPQALTAEENAGQQVFLDNKCHMCHSVESLEIERTSTSEKMQAADLSNVGAEHDAAWLAKYIKKEVQLDEEDHKKTWKGSDEELKAVADWLATLKTDG